MPSLLLTLLFAVTVREPARCEKRGIGAAAARRPLLGYARRRLGLFVSLVVGAGLCRVPAYAMVAWMPYMLQQVFGIATARVGLIFGGVAIAATVGGTLLLPYLVNRLQARRGRDFVARLSAYAALSAIVAVAAAGFATALPIFLALSGLGLMLLTGAANNILVAFQTLVPADMRATFAALCLLSITLLGLGVGPPALAALRSSMLASLNTAMAILCLGAALPAAALFGYASGRLRGEPAEAEGIL